MILKHSDRLRELGGPGSGNWGHLGIPGYRGGSQSGSGGIHARPDNYKDKKGGEKKEDKPKDTEKSKRETYIDDKSEFGATPELESKLDAALGDKNWDEIEVDAIKGAIDDNNKDVIITRSSEFKRNPDKGGFQSGSGGIFGGEITEEDENSIYMTGKEYTTKDTRVMQYKIPKNIEDKDYRGNVVKTFHPSKL